MPSGGGIPVSPHDLRLYAGSNTPSYTADATWEDGYYWTVTASAGSHADRNIPGTATLGDGDTAYLTAEIGYNGGVVWGPAADIPLAELQKSGGNPRLRLVRKSNGKLVGRFVDANGTAHDTAEYSLPNNNRNVYGVSVRRYISGGSTLVDVTLRDITGASDVATLTGDAITGADKTVSFDSVSSGWQASFGKGGTGEPRFGIVKCGFSSGISFDTGSAWGMADVDAIKLRFRKTGSGQSQLNAVALLTVYDDTASGDGWPTTTTVISVRLPTGDGSLTQWTPSTGTSHYALVDDAFGSYSASDYVNTPNDANTYDDEYTFPALSLSGKEVLCVGSFARANSAVTVDQTALNVDGNVSAYKGVTAVTVTEAQWWTLKPSGAAVSAKVVEVKQAVNRASTY